MGILVLDEFRDFRPFEPFFYYFIGYDWD